MKQTIKKPNIKISPIRTLKIFNPAADLSKPISKARTIKYIVSSIFSKYFAVIFGVVPDYFPIAFQLCSNYFPNIFQLFSKSFSNNFQNIFKCFLLCLSGADDKKSIHEHLKWYNRGYVLQF